MPENIKTVPLSLNAPSLSSVPPLTVRTPAELMVMSPTFMVPEGKVTVPATVSLPSLWIVPPLNVRVPFALTSTSPMFKEPFELTVKLAPAPVLLIISVLAVARLVIIG